MELSSREYGEAGRPPIVILHGLLGSSRNWQSAAQDLAGDFHAHCLDLRNHGESPWATPHSFDAMAGDVVEWMERRLDARPVLVGHSMGGKVAMKIACENPERIRKLVIVDIVPKTYPKTHDNEFAGMRAVDLQTLATRADAEAALEPHVPDWALRKFLLTNLIRDESGSGFRWQINLDAIEPQLCELEKSPLREDQRYEGDTLFAMGGKSSYFSKDDIPLVRRHFPASAIEVIADSGHNPHFERRERFVEILRSFAKSA